MSKKIQAFNHISFRQLVYECLSEFLSISTEDIQNKYKEDQKISLHKNRNDRKILYTSGLALRASNSQNQRAMEFASAIAFHVSASCGGVFNVQIVPPGWIHFELTDSALASWLQNLAVGKGEMGRWGSVGSVGSVGREGGKISSPSSQTSHTSCLPHAPCPITNSLFPVQHAHARCCSLVLLAHREGLIQLREPLVNSSPSFWSVISPDPIPWLNCDGRLRLNHPDELCLLSELVQAVDSIECPDIRSYVKWEKTGLNLSQAFENFWRNCRIWGEVKIVSPEVAQARLGLLMAAQSVLKFVLEENLRIFAPLEL
ncbi:MAG: DALR anticodon-binding domain-containing protein [Nostoc sp. ChiSLP02]|nr:DALR anticodon-binding domain-containing protein [Nostoc sp. DedSLP05]MDZ8103735.1 DALR anticodon-binding domain-containing protein [Nostoc sp. DedSLP01]MDZ8184310.1 DALR anticodon-binding domain-containing protein [Nostoc sp. ChiSLP02]